MPVTCCAYPGFLIEWSYTATREAEMNASAEHAAVTQLMGCKTVDEFIATMWAEVISELPVTKTRKTISQRIHAYRDSTGNAVGHTTVLDS